MTTPTEQPGEKGANEVSEQRDDHEAEFQQRCGALLDVVTNTLKLRNLPPSALQMIESNARLVFTQGWVFGLTQRK